MANTYNTFIYFLVTATVAANGAIGVRPDYICFGASKEFNRTFFAHLPYKQAFGVSYLAAQRFIANVTKGCTMLDNAATVADFFEGVYSSILGALAMEQNGVKILSLYSGGGPVEPNLEMDFGLCKTLLFGLSYSVSAMAVLMFFMLYTLLLIFSS